MSGSPLRHPDCSLKLDVTRPPKRTYVCQFLARGMVPRKKAATMPNFFGIFCALRNPLKRQASAIAALAEPLNAVRFDFSRELGTRGTGFCVQPRSRILKERMILSPNRYTSADHAPTIRRNFNGHHHCPHSRHRGPDRGHIDIGHAAAA